MSVRTTREMARAWGVVQMAKRRGDLMPQPCEICGGEAEAHHDDYARPLDVRWLCHPHHMSLCHRDGVARSGRLTPFIDEIVTRRDAGEGLQDSADDFGVSREAIRLVAVKRGVRSFSVATDRARARRFFRAMAKAAQLHEQATRPYPHGTRAGYQRGCTCVECASANRERMRALKGTEPPRHGTESAYGNYGCRCDPCRRAGAEHNARFSAKRRAREDAA